MTKRKPGSNGRTWTQLNKAYEGRKKHFDSFCKDVYETYAESDAFTDIAKRYGLTTARILQIFDSRIVNIVHNLLFLTTFVILFRHQ